MKVVDTSFLIEYARGTPAVEAYLSEHEDETVIVPAIVFQEFAVGEVLARNASKAAVAEMLGAFDIRPYTAEHAYHAACIEAALRDHNAYDPMLKSDVLIGAVARSLGCHVLTRNTTDFGRFDGVTVEPY